MKKMWKVMTKQKTPKTMYVFHVILVKAGATKKARAKLKIH